MRAFIAATAATLIWIPVAYAEAVKGYAPAPAAAHPLYSPSSMAIEHKAEQASQEQGIRDKKFDEQVRRATNSICIGCLRDASPRATAAARHSSARSSAAAR